MKTLKRLSLKNDSEILSDKEKKFVLGGGYGNGSNYSVCHCSNGEIREIDTCSKKGCEDLCDGPVQNCNS